MTTACRVVDAAVAFEDLALRVPLRFGTGVVESTRLATARVTVEGDGGRRADGLGQILLSELWSFPSARVERPLRLRAMERVARWAMGWLANEQPRGHALEIGWRLKGETPGACREATEALALAEPLPLLAGLVAASPFDAAVHDAFGRLLERSAYDCYGPDTAPDLGVFLGPAFGGRYAAEYLLPAYRPRVPIWHLVGGLDKLRESEVGADDPRDALPVSLERWIEREGLFCLKVKTTGYDVDADVRRVADVYEVATRALESQGGRRPIALSVDSNEQTENVAACVAFLEKLRREHAAAFDALLYLEQPTGRDLRGRAEDVRPAARLKPVLVDEAVAEVADLDLAYALGWSGVALKTCKGHTATLLSIAKTVAAGKVYSVQDLTNPAAAYMHSVGLAARTNPLRGVEANARQFIPQANAESARRCPALFTVRDGEVSTEEIGPLGLGRS